MNSIENNLKLRAQSWPLLGPLAAFTTAMLIIFKSASIYWPLALLTLAGLFVCWQWRMRGFFAAISGLAVLAAYQLLQNPTLTNGTIWQIGLTISAGLAFFITTLCRDEWESFAFEEKKSHDDIINNALREPLQRLNELESTYKNAQELWGQERKSTNELWQNERSELQTAKSRFESEAIERAATLLENEKTIHTIRKELEATRTRQEVLEADLVIQRREYEINWKQLNDAKNQLAMYKDAKQAISAEQEKRVELENLLSQRNIEIQELSQKLEKTLRTSQEQSSQALQEANNNHAQVLQETNTNHSKLLQEIQAQHERSIDALKKESQELLHLTIKQTESSLQEKFKIREAELKIALDAAENDFLNIESKRKQSEDELKRVQDLLTASSIALDELKKQATSTHASLNQTIEEQAFQIDKYKTTETSLQEKINVLEQQKASLDNSLSSLQEQLNTVQKDKDFLRNKLDANRVIRRNEGMFKQLREQFEEKSSTLDAARHELFQTQEKLLALERKWNDKALLDLNEEHASIERHLAHFEHEYKQLSNEYAQEVETLHDLIATLLQEQANAKA